MNDFRNSQTNTTNITEEPTILGPDGEPLRPGELRLAELTLQNTESPVILGSDGTP